MPKFKCDFCKKRGVKRVMLWHEPTCFRNPSRVCFLCDNTGEVDAGADVYGMYDCPACAKFDKNKYDAIEKYKKTGEYSYEFFEKDRVIPDEEEVF